MGLSESRAVRLLSSLPVSTSPVEELLPQIRCEEFPSAYRQTLAYVIAAQRLLETLPIDDDSYRLCLKLSALNRLFTKSELAYERIHRGFDKLLDELMSRSPLADRLEVTEAPWRRDAVETYSS